MTDFSSSRFSLWAVIDGVTVDCLSYEGNFSLNSVPTATINVALGREVNSLKPSPAHNLNLTRKTKVKVYWQAKNNAGTTKEKWKPGTQLLFDGDLVGDGYGRSPESVSLSLPLQHWLGRLGSGSCISGTSHPSNAADLTFNGAGPSNLCADISAFAGPANTDIIKYVSEGLTTDLWENGLKPWFKCLASQETLNTHDLVPGKRPSARPDLVPAIERIKSAVPIKLNTKNGNVGVLGRAIADSIVAKAKSPQQIYSATMWDVLVAIASEYFLAIVPCIDVVYLVPYIPGLRKPYGKVAGTDFGQFGYQAGLSKPWRAVGMLGSGLSSAFGPISNAGPASRQNALAGYFENTDSPNGLIVYKTLPSWLDGDQSAGYAASTVGVGGKQKATALNPDAGEAPQKDPPEKEAKAQTDLRHAYAQCVYVEEALRSRQDTISEQRLRVDLAPGSVVSVESVGEKFIDKDGTNAIMYGTIAQVTIGMNAQSGGAGTAYQINNIRNKEENTKDATSVEAHPLWTNSFHGKPLQ